MLSASLSWSECDKRLSAECDRSFVVRRFFSKMLKSRCRLIMREVTIMVTTICGLVRGVLVVESEDAAYQWLVPFARLRLGLAQ
jgi:hypothetical protein